MKIGIDARFVGPEGTGLGKYTEKLILNLAKIDKNNKYVIFLKRDNFNYLKFSQNNFRKIIADVNWYSIEEQIKLPGIFFKEKLDLLHIPHFNVPVFYKGNFVVTIHDLIHHHFKEQSVTTKNPLLFNLKRIGYKFVVRNAVKKSLKILVPSDFVKDEIIKYFQVDPGKIMVTYEAAEEEYSGSEDKQLPKLKNTLLYVGNVYFHKNISNLINAVKILKENKKEVRLIIVSPRDIFWQRLNKEIESRNLQGTVTLKPYQETKELVKLFSQVTAYVFPSLSEGFGIPGLNAMAASLPVIASSIPVLKEVYKDAALYFDPRDPADIAKKIEKLLDNPKLRSDLINKGFKQVNAYSWETMARETLKVYLSAKI